VLYRRSHRTKSCKRIAYIIGSFPSLTKTFVDREIQEAERQGVDLVLVAARRPAPFEMRAEVKKLAEETKYILPVPWLKFLGGNLYLGLARPRAYLSTLLYLLTRQHDTAAARIKTFFHFAEGTWAAWLLWREGIDHIHAHFADRAAVVAMVASKFLGVSYSLTAHANDIYVSPVMLQEKIANAKFVTTCTAYNKAHLESMTGRRIELVYHGLDLTAIEPAPQTARNSHPPLILSVGRLVEKKGFPYLIKACRWLQDWGCDFRCEIIGEGPKRGDLEGLVTDLNLQDQVILRGALPNAEVMARYTQAAIFALPCVIAGDGDRDGIPNVLLEAMANLVPVVSTRVSGIPEVVQDGVTGLLVDPGSEEALAKAMARFLHGAQLGEELAQKGYRRVKEEFDVRTNVRQLIELFES
jgi:glycosyltransferase involved in cell wall biosynthesis